MFLRPVAFLLSLEKFLPFPKGLHTRSLCSPLLQTFLSQPPQAGCVACVGAISISQCQAATHNTSCFISAPTPPTLLGKKPPTTGWCDGRGERWGGLTGPLPTGQAGVPCSLSPTSRRGTGLWELRVTSGLQRLRSSPLLQGRQ